MNIKRLFLIIFLLSANSIYAAENNDDNQAQNNHEDPILADLRALGEGAVDLNLVAVQALHERARAGNAQARGILAGLQIVWANDLENIINEDLVENQTIRNILGQY